MQLRRSVIAGLSVMALLYFADSAHAQRGFRVPARPPPVRPSIPQRAGHVPIVHGVGAHGTAAREEDKRSNWLWAGGAVAGVGAVAGGYYWVSRARRKPAPDSDRIDQWTDPSAAISGLATGDGRVETGSPNSAPLPDDPIRRFIRIKGMPDGEAPERIRAAWVGLELPVALGDRRSHKVDGLGIRTEESTANVIGYLVSGVVAVAVLDASSPAAAAWWREEAPHVLASDYHFVFETDVCEVIAPSEVMAGSWE